VSTDTTPGPEDGKLQKRPAVQGVNYFLRDGYLVEVTKKESYRYSANRITTLNRMNFRYGLLETRIIIATN